MVVITGTNKIIVEVYENQHMSYACECEQTRMRQIYFDLGGQDLVFIRYNPDSYKDQYGKKKLTCDVTRERTLLDLLKCFDSIEEQVRIYYMYYDGFLVHMKDLASTRILPLIKQLNILITSILLLRGFRFLLLYGWGFNIPPTRHKLVIFLGRFLHVYVP